MEVQGGVKWNLVSAAKHGFRQKAATPKGGGFCKATRYGQCLVNSVYYLLETVRGVALCNSS